MRLVIDGVEFQSAPNLISWEKAFFRAWVFGFRAVSIRSQLN